MNEQDILAYVSNHPSGKVKVAISDVDGVLRGKYVSTEKFLSIIKDHIGFCDVAFGWDMADVAYDNASYTGWHSGYPDTPVKIDLNSFRRIPWEDELPFFLGSLSGSAEQQSVCPRNLLKQVIGEAESLGYTPFFSQEFEWYNFIETPQSAQDKAYKNLQPLSPGMFGYSILRSTLNEPFFKDLFEQLTKFDIPIEGLHTETGPGVLEAAIKYGHCLEAADRAILFKTAVKEIGYLHGILPTFMAKINENLPGCSGHVHQSLADHKGQNLFHDANDAHGMSHLMKQYIAGQLHCLPFILPMIAPTINSYKRLVEGAWAPTTVTWAMDNRTVALRAITTGSKSCRLETRVVGSDSNPYLASAACLAAGLYGIKNKLALNQAATKGSGYQDKQHGVLSKTLGEAVEKMQQSDIAETLFGKAFTQHFLQTREWEWRQSLRPVTDWELKRYLEII